MPERDWEDTPPEREEGEDSHARARSRALRVLARREVSRRELGTKLHRAGFSRGAVSDVLDELQEQGLLDDQRFCRLYLRSQARARPRSWRLLRRDAAGKGISEEILDQVRAEMDEEVSEEALAEAAARKKLRAAAGDVEKLRRALAARGFTPSTAEKAIREVMGEDYERRDDPESFEHA